MLQYMLIGEHNVSMVWIRNVYLQGGVVSKVMLLLSKICVIHSVNVYDRLKVEN